MNLSDLSLVLNLVPRLQRNERTSPDSTGAAVVVPIGVATEVVSAVEEVIARTVLAGGASWTELSTSFIVLITRIAEGAAGGTKIQLTKVLQYARRNACSLPALYICNTMYLPSHTAIHY